MSSDSAQKDGSALLEELYMLTNRMVEQRHDADFLTQSVVKRQELIEAYDRWAEQDPSGRAILEKDVKARQTVDKILAMDKVILKALEQFKLETQKDVATSKAQQKVIGYLGNTVSSSGSYLDYKLR